MPRKIPSFSRHEIDKQKEINRFERSTRSRQQPEAKTDPPITQTSCTASVFVSYAREDLQLIRPLVARLRKLGLVVIWDQDFLPGDDFESKIRSSIKKASVVMVIWSPISIKSGFVRDEARLAYHHNKLAPVATDNLQISDIPLGFGILQATRISDFEAISQGLLSRSLISQGATASATAEAGTAERP